MYISCIMLCIILKGAAGLTVKELAEELHVTPMTIYRRLQRRGIDIATLREGEGGILTQHGAAVIASLFDGEPARNTSRTAGITAGKQLHNSDMEQLENGFPSAFPSAAVLAAKLEAEKEKCAMLEAERARLEKLLESTQNALEGATRALELEQADRANERLALTANDSSGLLGRLRRLFKS